MQVLLHSWTMYVRQSEGRPLEIVRKVSNAADPSGRICTGGSRDGEDGGGVEEAKGRMREWGGRGKRSKSADELGGWSQVCFTIWPLKANQATMELRSEPFEVSCPLASDLGPRVGTAHTPMQTVLVASSCAHAMAHADSMGVGWCAGDALQLSAL